MLSVGEQLRVAREAQKLSVHQIAEVTKIKTEHIRSLEEGNYNVFAAPIYIRGFVRAYANVLNVEVPPIMAMLDSELSQLEKFRGRPSLVAHRRGPLDFVMYHLSKLNWRVAAPALLAVLLLMMGVWSFRFWWRRSPADPLAKLGPGLYQGPVNAGEEFLPLPTNAPRK